MVPKLEASKLPEWNSEFYVTKLAHSLQLPSSVLQVKKTYISEQIYIGLKTAGFEQIYIRLKTAGFEQIYIRLKTAGLEQIYIRLKTAGFEQIYIGLKTAGIFVCMRIPRIPMYTVDKQFMDYGP